MNLKFFKILIILLILPSQVLADGNNKELSFYTGTFDVIDKEGDDKTSLFGIEHKNPDLFRDTFLGKFKPVTGAFITGKNSAYFYTGVEAQYKIGSLNFNPSFAPGLYHEGDGKDLGHVLEFKTELQISLDMTESSQFGFSYNHLSNASLGSKNPGANSYMFNFFKSF